ncbi:MAG: sulfurtransferase [Cyanophyceae cyanobacterium]|jgi:thiosulfate/3-mercaptopyruvate sulfurtransferase
MSLFHGFKPALRGSQLKLAGIALSLASALVIVPLTMVPHSQPQVVMAQSSSDAATEFVSPEWVAERLGDDNLRILDVRIAPFAYFTSHIPGAVHVPDNTFRGPNGVLPVQYWSNEQIAEIFEQAGISDGNEVLIYSDGNDILGATMVAYLLERIGHPGARVLDGGFKAYQAAELEVTKEFPEFERGSLTITDNPDVRVTLEDVAQFIEGDDVTFIDPRPADLFAGEVDVWARNGHIPGAKNLPWPTFTIGEDNFSQLKDLEEIQALLDERGITPEDDIVVTCSTGREATLQYVVLKHILGYPNVRVYEGSWTEYQQSDLPVETGPGA